MARLNFQDLKRHVFTADDWGVSPGVNRGIFELARDGLIGRVAIMTNVAYWQEGLAELAALPNVELGLHFNLTLGLPLANIPANPLLGKNGEFLPLSKQLLLWTTARRAKYAEMIASTDAELRAQAQVLTSAGIELKFMNGHQHAHILPGLMEGMAPVLKEFGILDVRLPYDASLWFSGKFPINLLSLQAKAGFDFHGFRYLPFCYPSLRQFRHPSALRRRLELASRRLEVIVHPAHENDTDEYFFRDSYTIRREVEFRALRQWVGV